MSARIVIKNRQIHFIDDFGATTSTTRARLEKQTADLVMQIETKIKSPKAMQQARETLSLYGQALARAKQNGL